MVFKVLTLSLFTFALSYPVSTYGMDDEHHGLFSLKKPSSKQKSHGDKADKHSGDASKEKKQDKQKKHEDTTPHDSSDSSKNKKKDKSHKGDKGDKKDGKKEGKSSHTSFPSILGDIVHGVTDAVGGLLHHNQTAEDTITPSTDTPPSSATTTAPDKGSPAFNILSSSLDLFSKIFGSDEGTGILNRLETLSVLSNSDISGMLKELVGALAKKTPKAILGQHTDIPAVTPAPSLDTPVIANTQNFLGHKSSSSSNDDSHPIKDAGLFIASNAFYTVLSVGETVENLVVKGKDAFGNVFHKVVKKGADNIDSGVTDTRITRVFTTVEELTSFISSAAPTLGQFIPNPAVAAGLSGLSTILNVYGKTLGAQEAAAHKLISMLDKRIDAKRAAAANNSNIEITPSAPVQS